MHSLICQICGQPFQSKWPQSKVCNSCKNRPCVICGRPLKNNSDPNQQCCSAACSREYNKRPEVIAEKEAKRRATVLEKYGTDNVAKLDEIRQKISNVKNTEEYKQKVKQTCLERYGTENVMQNDSVKAKFIESIHEKYGVDNISKLQSIKNTLSAIMKSDEMREHYKELSLERYGVPHPHMDPEIKAKTEQTMTKRYGVPYYVMLPEYRSAQATNQISLINREVANKLKEFGIESEFEFKIESKFFDLKLTDSNVVIEVDPSYTHSDLPNHWCGGLPLDYHLNKTELAKRNGYRCIHIFDWDDVDKICSLFTKKAVIFARNCKVKEISTETADEFIDEYHIQGNARGAKFAFGLFYNNQLVSAMTFSKPRFERKHQWELLRLCSHSDFKIVGGASKMFKAFIRTADPQSILSYCDLAKFAGEVYSQLGFKLHHTSPPAKVWSKEDKYITDNLLRQRGFDQLFGTNFGKGTSNEELMIENGWRSVYDCGQLVFEWLKP